MEPIHECRVVTHLWRHRGQEVPDPLLLLDIDVEVTHHDQTAISPDVFFPTAELARGHVAFHNVHTVLLIEGDTRNLVETNYVILTDETALSRCVVYKHLGDGRLSAGNQMGVR